MKSGYNWNLYFSLILILNSSVFKKK